MATVKISALTAATTPLAGTELLELVQGGVSTKVAARDVAASFSTNPANILPVSAGGTGASTAAAARTNLGATTVGSNLFTLANPSAVTFPRLNADNSVSALTASAFRSAISSAASGANSDITSLTGLTTALSVPQGGTGATTLTGYVKGNGASAMTAAATIPYNDLAGRAWINASSTLDQTQAAINTAKEFTLDTGTSGTGIAVNASSRVTFTDAGTYMLAPSIQFANSDAADHTATIWFRKNGTNIANSASVVSIPKAADGGVTVFSVTFIETVTAGQYIEVMWAVSNIAVTAAATVATAPAPAIPSIIVPVTRIA
jgi:hypothetical protein